MLLPGVSHQQNLPGNHWLLLACRTGQESTNFLIKVSEAYLSSHLLEGFSPDTAKSELEQTRTGVASGKIDETWDPAQQLEVVVSSPTEDGAGTAFELEYAVSVCPSRSCSWATQSLEV